MWTFFNSGWEQICVKSCKESSMRLVLESSSRYYGMTSHGVKTAMRVPVKSLPGQTPKSERGI